MKFEHAGITVTYNDKKDVWEFELRGRSRTAPTPAKAKEFIDKEPAPDKAKPFPRFKALKRDGDTFTEVEVTSVAEYTGRFSEFTEFWIQGPKSAYRDSGREKIYSDQLLVISPENAMRITAIAAATAERKALNDKIAQMHSEMVTVTIPEGF